MPDPIYITFNNRALKLQVTHCVRGYQSDVEDYAINVLGITTRDYFLSHEADPKTVSADVKVQYLKRQTKFIVKV